jgi:hypothetical protein
MDFTQVQKPIFIADAGKSAMHVLDVAKDKVMRFTPEEFLANSWLPANSSLVIENSHLGCARTELSLAQVYTEKELLSLYAVLAAKGCELRLFPQGLTAKARAMAGFGKKDKNDEVDLRSIAFYLKASPKTTLRKPPTTFVTKRRLKAGWQFAKETNRILNVGRRYSYQRDDDFIASFVEKNLNELADRVSDETKRVMLLTDDQRQKKNPAKWLSSSARRLRLYTLASLFIDSQGFARSRPDTQKLPGIAWLKDCVLHFSPFHQNAGIARSNIMYHALKSYISASLGTKGTYIGDFTEEQHEASRLLRQEFMRGITETMQTIRDLVQEKLDNGELALR